MGPMRSIDKSKNQCSGRSRGVRLCEWSYLPFFTQTAPHETAELDVGLKNREDFTLE